MPVITVPNPFIENTLSILSLAGEFSFLSSISSLILSIFSIRVSIPLLDIESTSIISASSRKVPFIFSQISSFTSSLNSSSTVSDLVRTTIPFLIFKKLRISKCSTVCGITPSSAATTSKTISIPDAPANMFFINFSCPGTSTIPALLLFGKSK